MASFTNSASVRGEMMALKYDLVVHNMSHSSKHTVTSTLCGQPPQGLGDLGIVSTGVCPRSPDAHDIGDIGKDDQKDILRNALYRTS